MKIFKFLSFTPWFFIFGFILLVICEILMNQSIDFKHNEYRSNFFRWGLIFNLYLTFMYIPLNLYFWLKKDEQKNVFFYFLGILILVFFIIFNPFHLFTWFMG